MVISSLSIPNNKGNKASCSSVALRFRSSYLRLHPFHPSYVSPILTGTPEACRRTYEVLHMFAALVRRVLSAFLCSPTDDVIRNSVPIYLCRPSDFASTYTSRNLYPGNFPKLMILHYTVLFNSITRSSY
jgi:hypothetical protein